MGSTEKRDRFQPTWHRRWGYCGAMINKMATTMAVNSANMLALHFRRRLHQYVRFRYAKEGKIQLSYNKTKKLVDSCYRVHEVQAFDTNGNPTATTTMWGAWDKWRTLEQRELREWLGMEPCQWTIRENLGYFVTKVYDMLSWMEGFVEKHPKTRGAHLYSLLPQSSSFIPSHVTLNATTLYEHFCRIYDDPVAKEFVNGDLGLECKTKAARTTWTLNREVILRKIFNVTELETRTASSVTKSPRMAMQLRNYSSAKCLPQNPQTPIRLQGNGGRLAKVD
ncbi:hypothetical protein PPTG_12100 [Phytophthora nicotianae INRA-310]|uniref:Uncharacterized protein n=1 Tax=Phytophthora nicotianae (strain INRA-310) TaxID=761204 RepID=W2Q618_PHYN3|nr:hypothetical protein PPTG_12100 [Phytophthora nicotianae INRA-310]ETN08281.1 hypothetical protein PPTG_12100 [Phytophthora nicotianae INRA-310]